MNCDVYEYFDVDAESQLIAWVWKEKKFPVKLEVSNYFGKTSIFFDDIRLNEPIPESLFELPKDAKLIDMTQEMPKIGDLLKEYQ